MVDIPTTDGQPTRQVDMTGVNTKLIEHSMALNGVLVSQVKDHEARLAAMETTLSAAKHELDRATDHLDFVHAWIEAGMPPPPPKRPDWLRPHIPTEPR